MTTFEKMGLEMHELSMVPSLPCSQEGTSGEHSLHYTRSKPSLMTPEAVDTSDFTHQMRRNTYFEVDDVRDPRRSFSGHATDGGQETGSKIKLPPSNPISALNARTTIDRKRIVKIMTKINFHIVRIRLGCILLPHFLPLLTFSSSEAAPVMLLYLCAFSKLVSRYGAVLQLRFAVGPFCAVDRTGPSPPRPSTESAKTDSTIRPIAETGVGVGEAEPSTSTTGLRNDVETYRSKEKAADVKPARKWPLGDSDSSNEVNTGIHPDASFVPSTSAAAGQEPNSSVYNGARESDSSLGSATTADDSLISMRTPGRNSSKIRPTSPPLSPEYLNETLPDGQRRLSRASSYGNMGREMETQARHGDGTWSSSSSMSSSSANGPKVGRLSRLQYNKADAVSFHPGSSVAANWDTRPNASSSAKRSSYMRQTSNSNLLSEFQRRGSSDRHVSGGSGSVSPLPRDSGRQSTEPTSSDTPVSPSGQPRELLLPSLTGLRSDGASSPSHFPPSAAQRWQHNASLQQKEQQQQQEQQDLHKEPIAPPESPETALKNAPPSSDVKPLLTEMEKRCRRLCHPMETSLEQSRLGITRETRASALDAIAAYKQAVRLLQEVMERISPKASKSRKHSRDEERRRLKHDTYAERIRLLSIIYSPEEESAELSEPSQSTEGPEDGPSRPDLDSDAEDVSVSAPPLIAIEQHASSGGNAQGGGAGEMKLQRSDSDSSFRSARALRSSVVGALKVPGDSSMLKTSPNMVEDDIRTPTTPYFDVDPNLISLGDESLASAESDRSDRQSQQQQLSLWSTSPSSPSPDTPVSAGQTSYSAAMNRGRRHANQGRVAGSLSNILLSQEDATHRSSSSASRRNERRPSSEGLELANQQKLLKLEQADQPAHESKTEQNSYDFPASGDAGHDEDPRIASDRQVQGQQQQQSRRLAHSQSKGSGGSSSSLLTVRPRAITTITSSHELPQQEVGTAPKPFLVNATTATGTIHQRRKQGSSATDSPRPLNSSPSLSSSSSPAIGTMPSPDPSAPVSTGAPAAPAVAAAALGAPLVSSSSSDAKFTATSETEATEEGSKSFSAGRKRAASQPNNRRPSIPQAFLMGQTVPGQPNGPPPVPRITRKASMPLSPLSPSAQGPTAGLRVMASTNAAQAIADRSAGHGGLEQLRFPSPAPSASSGYHALGTPISPYGNPIGPGWLAPAESWEQGELLELATTQRRCLLSRTSFLQRGAYLSQRLYVPKELWSQPGGSARLLALDTKIKMLELVSNGLEAVDVAGRPMCKPPSGQNPGMEAMFASRFAKQLEDFDAILVEVQNTLAKKLGFVDGWSASSSSGKKGGSAAGGDSGAAGGSGIFGSKFTRGLDRLAGGGKEGENMNSSSSSSSTLVSDSPAGGYVDVLSRLLHEAIRWLSTLELCAELPAKLPRR
ncbi:hypothetical protein L7F22_056533 [Adiantum nelumboides]|nr:hypothetical protein [Adiantum nelumboides]